MFLLYNTFRVLGPAFHVRSSVTQQKDLESVPSVDHLPYGATPSNMTWTYTPEKIDRYRSELSTYSAASLESANRKYSTQSLLPARGAFTASYSENVPSSPYSQRSIIVAPDAVLQPPMQRLQAPTVYPRSLPLTQSMAKSLPVPPRPTPSPLTIKSSVESLSNRRNIDDSSTNGPLTPMSAWTSHTSVYSSRTAASRRGSSSSEVDVDDFPSSQQPNGYRSHRVDSQPMLSAVAPSFPTEYPSSPVSVRESRPGVGFRSSADDRQHFSHYPDRSITSPRF